jgi:hypothetical protein
MKHIKSLNPFKPIQLFFAKILKQRIEKRVQKHQTIKYLEYLIEEYRLIQKKESKLSSTERRKVIKAIDDYVESGHIIEKK